MFDLIMDSVISKVFIDAATAINTKGLKFRLVVCLILFLFFLNSAECQQLPRCKTTEEFPPCIDTNNECDLLDPVSCLIDDNKLHVCCFNGCRYVCRI
ncbi:UNVERIFIED_CONTAM: hypothetical protein RMT77_011087 [Armadillidium vulgare]